MKKSFMTRVLAVSLSAAMAFSMSSASNLMTASAASTVNLKTTFKTLKVNQTYKMTLKNNTLNWKITKVTTSNKKICTVYGKTASSVMLKGKGVGRAKITVKVKTTKRKYPKNIKLMKCTANVKAADTSTPEAFSAQATASGNTQVNVTFSQAVDGAEISNFAVSDNVQVTEVKLSDDKKTAVLTIGGAEYDKSYDLTVTGIKVGGKEQAEQKLTFKTPASTVEYPVSLTTDKETLKSNGETQTVVTFTIKDKNGNLVTDKGIEVAFSASLGTFAEQRVTVQNGTATNVYTAPTLMETQKADLRAVIVESTENQELLNISATKKITLSPSGEDTSIGAVITSITAPTADRIYAYFNQTVDAADFVKGSKNRLDKSKFDATVWSEVDNGKLDGGRKTDVVGVLPVPGEDKALQLLVADPMTDNSNIVVKFKNKTQSNGTFNPENTVSCKLTDARQPSVLDVSTNDNSDITVQFSEAMLLRELCDGGSASADRDQFFFAADNPENYKLDGVPLSNLDVEILSAGGEATDDTTGAIKRLSVKNDTSEGKGTGKGSIQGGKYADSEDKRAFITIKLGTRARSVLGAGQHTLTISNVGDWAAKTDHERNIVNTQTMGFTVKENNELPNFTVEVQSPEQYKIKFNNAFDLVETGDTVKISDSTSTAWNSVIELQQQDGSTWRTISDADGSGKNPIRVSKVTEADPDEPDTYVVEVRKDWTEVYNTASTKRNYYNYKLRLHVDAGRLVNLANGKQNEDINVELDGDIMRSMDVTSPTIDEVEQAEDKNGNLVNSYNIKLSEPVKMSSDANLETLTPSQTQSNAWNQNDKDKNMGVPAPSAQFINADGSKTVDGLITTNAFMDAYDQVINVEPLAALDPGEWRVVVSSISDDYGNTAATAVHPVTITGETTTTDFKIVWAAVGDKLTYDPAEMGTTGFEYGRYIYVKFSKPVNLVGLSANALTSGNYSIDGATVPTGTNVFAKIRGYDDEIQGVTDSITIELPESRYANTSQYKVSALNTILNVSKAITSQAGETLSGDTNIRLPYNYGSAADIRSLKAETDAVWGNHADERLGTSGTTLERYKEYYQKFKDALENDKYRKVILTQPLDLTSSADNDINNAVKAVFGRSNTLTIKRAVDLELQDNITGNVSVATSDVVNSMKISSPTSKNITGYNSNSTNDTATLTVDAVNMGIELDGVVVNAGTNNKYAIKINDVYANTFKNNGTVNGHVIITDANGAGFASNGTVSGDLLINTNGRVNLKEQLKVRTILVNGAAIVDLDNADLRGVKMSVNAPNARIILRESTQVNNQTVIIAEAKDVRVTVPASKTNATFLTGANGSFIAVTEGNREVTTSSDTAVVVGSFHDANADKTAVAQVLSKLDVYTGTVGETAVTSSQTVTRSAISGGALLANLSTQKQGIITQVKNAVGVISGNADEDSDGREYGLDITYSLVIPNGLKQDNENITVISGQENNDGKSEIKVTIKVTKGGETVSEVTRWIYASKDGK